MNNLYNFNQDTAIDEFGVDHSNFSVRDELEYQTIINDSKKDLQNNLYGSNLGANNPNRSCLDLLDDMRTPNMRKLNIR